MNTSIQAPGAGAPGAGGRFRLGLPAGAAQRSAVTAAWRLPEPQALAPLLAQARLPAGQAAAVRALAWRLADTLRRRSEGGSRTGLVPGLLQEFALSSPEGLALMCLAEALLRIPDAATRDALIRDKIAPGRWQAHLGRSRSPLVNAAAWGLLLTGRLVSAHDEHGPFSAFARLAAAGGEPLIRAGVDAAMRAVGEQFVLGETIGQALANARHREARGYRHSYDMLGEAALTAADAQRYLQAYEEAIHAIGRACAGRGIHEGPGISVKLSALHPRYCRAQQERVSGELYPALLMLAGLAKRYDIGLNIDAEEADRLELSLDLLGRLCREPALAGWNGLGFVVQAYQKRCPAVIEHLIALARATGRRLMLRLVKGAYWDSEIKRTQAEGLDDYPVYTRKPHTDVCYLACARRLLEAPDAVYPQFATHNAYTLAAVHHLAGPERYASGQYEFQCLHGMGEALYDLVVGPPEQGRLGRPCRIYAPVGSHETLLAYLVRRLLENGANTSFVHRIADPSIAIDALIEDPVQAVERIAGREGAAGLPHPSIPLPRALYEPVRANSQGLDLASDRVLAALQRSLNESAGRRWRAAPMLAEGRDDEEARRPVINPADHRDLVGLVREASFAEVDEALRGAAAGAAQWAAVPAAERAAILERAADALQVGMPVLVGLLVREAGKTLAAAQAEAREAVDFLRYYAACVRRGFDNATHRPLGPVACISPWNFPLAIFTGQVAAALAAGNAVLAKPAEQTPLIAAQAVQALWRAGVPRSALQLLPGPGETVGARLVADARVQGVVFTGSTEVARLLQQTLAGRLGADGRPVPLIAETGGQNAMIVDSSALPEQVVADVLVSAFDSAGQRCSALRVLCVQQEVAPRITAMLEGAMAELCVGDPAALSTDVGPVIDEAARAAIERHVEALRTRGRRVYRIDPPVQAYGSFVPPTLIELDGLADLKREVFGPVLHLLRYRREDLDALIAGINGTGYGLTLGLHTRIDETVAHVLRQARAGNVYVNRNMVGAVVGVQPFGGEGLSGTGPKAGGPLYLYRLLSARPDEALAAALAREGVPVRRGAGRAAEGPAPRPAASRMPQHAAADAASPAVPPAVPPAAASVALDALRSWADAQGLATLAAACERFARLPLRGFSCELAGPTGERNVYSLLPREAVLCLAGNGADRLVQLAAVLAAGGTAVWPAADAAPLRERLPAEVQARIRTVPDWSAPDAAFDAVLCHGDAARLREVCGRIAQRPGPIVGVHGFAEGETAIAPERLVVERALSVNTAAAGGNASLMMLD